MMGLANQTTLRWTSKSATASGTIFSKNVQGRPEDLVGKNIQKGREHEILGNVKLRQTCGMTDLVGRQNPKKSNVEDWGKLMTTYNCDPTLTDGFTACWTCALYAGGWNCNLQLYFISCSFPSGEFPFRLHHQDAV